MGYFHGDKLYLESQNGDVKIDKYQGDIVKIITHNGHIEIKELIQASDIQAVVLNEGVSILIIIIILFNNIFIIYRI